MNFLTAKQNIKHDKLEQQAINAFLQANPEFNLKHFNFFKKGALDQINWPEGVEKETLLRQIKAFQRLYRLIDDHEVITKLYNEGLHSAYQIASMSPHRFVANYGDCFNNKAQAQGVYKKSLAIKSRAVNTYLAIAQQTKPHYRGRKFDNTSQLTDENYSRIPSYQELFGDVDYCTCEDCRSIYSPAAYFVDLMSLQAQYIDIKGGVNPAYLLENRRPDLWYLPLSCENTNKQISKLTIVNEVLENKYKLLTKLTLDSHNPQDLQETVFADLTKQSYPFNLPFDLPLSQINQYLTQNKMSLADIWISLNGTVDLTYKNVALAALGLSAEQWQLYSTSKADSPNTLCGYYGFKTVAELDTLIDVKVFLKRTGLNYDQLNQLLTEDLSSEEVGEKLNKQFFINIGTADAITLVNNELMNLIPKTNDGTDDYSRLDHIHRFIRLALAMNWSFTDLDWALRSIAYHKDPTSPSIVVEINHEALVYLAWMQILQTKKSLSVNQCCSLFYLIKDFGDASGTTFFDSIYNASNVLNPPAWQNPAGKYDLNWNILESDSTTQANDQQIQAALAAALAMNQTDLITIATVMAQGKDKLTLSLENLSMLYRLSLISKMMGLPAYECLRMVNFIHDVVPAAKKHNSFILILVLQLYQWTNASLFTLTQAQMQYILTGESYNITLENQSLGQDAIANFLMDFQSAITPTLFTETNFSDALDSILKQSEWSVEAIDTVYTALQKQNFIDDDSVVQVIPSDSEMRAILSDVYPTGTSDDDIYLNGLNIDLVAILTEYSGKTLTQEKFREVSQEDFIRWMRSDHLTTTIWENLQTTYVDGSGIVEQSIGIVKATSIVKSIVFPDIPDALLTTIADLVQSTLNYYYELQQNTLISQLAGLYGISSQLVPALEILGGLSFGDLSVAQAQESVLFVNAYASVPLLQCLFVGKVTEKNERLLYLQRYAYLFSQVFLVSAEANSLVEHPEHFNITYKPGTIKEPLFQFTYSNIQTMNIFKRLIQEFQDGQNQFLSYFNEVEKNTLDATQASVLLSAITNWDETQLQFLAAQTWPEEKMSPNWGKVQGIWQLYQWFQLSKSLNLNMQALWQINQLYFGTLSSENNYLINQYIADELWGGLTRTYAKQPDVLSSIQNNVNQVMRAALIPIVIYLLNTEESTLLIKTTNDLYQYLLIDVEVNGIVQTSRVVEANSALQLYFYRCINKLEPQATIQPELIQWWDWIQNYRVWEANRHVFLYPENYMQPELRTGVTPLFTRLKNDLQQGDLAETLNIEKAFQNYMDGFAQVADLEIMSCASYDRVIDEYNKSKTLCFVGATEKQPYSYYYCLATYMQSSEKGHYIPGTWGPWLAIGLNINPVGLISPVFAFGRWFIFWVERQEIGKSDTTTQYKQIIYYSYLNFNQEWVAPQELDEVVPLLSDIPTVDFPWNTVYPVFFQSTQAIHISYGNNYAKWQAQILTVRESTLVNGAVSALTYATATTPMYFGLINFNVTYNNTIYSYVYPYNRLYKGYTQPPLNFGKSVNLQKGISLCVANGLIFTVRVDVSSDKNYLICGYLDPNDKSRTVQHEKNTQVGSAYQASLAALNTTELYMAYRGNSSENLYCTSLQIANPDNITKKGTLTINNQSSPFQPALAILTGTEGPIPYLAWINKSDNKIYFAKLPIINGDSGQTVNKIDLGISSSHAPSMTVYNNNLYIAWIDKTKGYLCYGRIEINGNNYKLTNSYSSTITSTVAPSIFGTMDRLYISWIDTGFQVNYGWLNTAIAAFDLNGVTKLDNGYSGQYVLSQLPSALVFVDNRLEITYVSKNDNQAYWTIHALYVYDTDLLPGISIFAMSIWFRANQSTKETPLIGELITVKTDEKATQLIINIGQGNSPLTVTSSGYWDHIVLTYNDSTKNYDVYFNGKLTSLKNISVFFPYYFLVGKDYQNTLFQGDMQEVLIYNRSLTQTEIEALYNNTVLNKVAQLTQDWEKYVTAQEAFAYPVQQVPIIGQPNWYIVKGQGAQIISSYYQNKLLKDKLDCYRLNSTAFYTLSQYLCLRGINGLLTVRAQGSAEIPFANLQPVTTYIATSPSNDIDFSGSLLSQYYWEIFFHAPFLIAYTLQTQMQYEEAQTWYQYIFNPTGQADYDVKAGHENDQYWNFIGLRSAYNQTLEDELDESWAMETQDDLNEAAQLNEYHNDPFNPFAIAQLRPIAYQKTIVMNYVDNLIHWGDMLYTQYTSESMVEAMMLYVTAQDLLGNNPVNVGPCDLPEAMTLNQILVNSETGTLADLPEFLINVEQVQGDQAVIETGQDNPNNYIPGDYFGLPENAQLISYWDTIQKRLYSIRNSLTITGAYQQPALFQPPIKPSQLMQQIVSGEAINQQLSMLQTNVPYYRFEVMIEKAKEIANTVIQFGQSLLSCLEKQDAEALALLYNLNSQNILVLQEVAKQQEIEAATQTILALQAGLQNAQDRLTFYMEQIQNGLSSAEKAQIALDAVAITSQIRAQSIKGVSIKGYLLPNIFGVGAFGGVQVGEAVSQGANIMEGIAQAISMSSNLAGTTAGYQRRTEDWTLQQTLAQDDVNQANCQILAAQYQQSAAKQELKILQKTLMQEQNVAQYLKSKFTNQQLYQWMIGRITNLYFQAYQLAYDYALQAQQAYQFEKAITQSFIKGSYWDNLYQGLLTGESLLLDLQSMESTYMKQNARRFEIQKIISLAQHDPDALKLLQTTGSCNFSFNEKHFNDDYIGHYCRQIKTIVISFPAVLGPYQNIHATLTQTSNTVIIKDDVETMRYYSTGEGAPNSNSVRVDMRANQQIALSQNVDDSGLFELNFNDARYLPFEGTGVISSWTLSIPRENNPNVLENLTDVIIRLLYTAVPGKSVKGSL